MRDPEWIEEILNDLRSAWLNFPDMRLTQLVSCAAHIVSKSDDDDPFFIEDDRMREGFEVLQRLEY